jgi:Mu transposase, C-terminal
VETAGYAPVPLAADDYIELLPAVWRAINAYGVKIRRRTYDCKALNPYRRQHSGVNARKGLWEVHYDPYDITRVWVRNHHDSGWIQARGHIFALARPRSGNRCGTTLGRCWPAVARTRPPNLRSPKPQKRC